MGLKNWLDSKAKNLGWFDVGMVKWATFAFALMLAKLWSPLLSLNWYWYAAIGVLVVIKPMHKMFKGQSVHNKQEQGPPLT